MKKYLTFLLIFSTLHIFAQRTISGVVRDTAGEPLLTVPILIKGSSEYTLTNWDGQYNIKIQSKDSILIFSLLGYKTKEILVGKLDTIDVVLEEIPIKDFPIVSFTSGCLKPFTIRNPPLDTIVVEKIKLILPKHLNSIACALH